MIVSHRRWLNTIALLLLTPSLAVAQDYDTEVAFGGGAYFFIAVIAGVILAFAFQLILTTLSVAAGVSAMDDLDEPRHGSHHGGSGRAAGHGKDTGDTLRMISSVFGVWTLITASLSLFLGSWLGVYLSVTPNLMSGAVLGLTIWGLFYLLMTNLEVSAVSSLVGSLVHLAGSGLRSVFSTVGGVFSRSPESRVVDTATDVARAVKDELLRDVDTNRVWKELQRYVDELRASSFDPKELRHELAKLFDDTEIQMIAAHEGDVVDVETMAARLQTEHGLDAEKAKAAAGSVKDAMASIRDEAQKDKRPADKAVDSALRVGGMSPDQAEEFRGRIEQYLSQLDSEALDPEGVKQDLEKLFEDPRGGAEALKDRLSHVSSDDITHLVSQRTDLSEEQARKIVDTVGSVVQGLRDRLGGQPSGPATGTQVAKTHRGVGEMIDHKLRQYFDGLNRPELRYRDVKRDFQLLLHDPSAGFDALMHRFKAMDRDSLKAIIAQRRDISEEDAEHIVSQMEASRDEMVAKVEQAKLEAERRLEQAKREALHQAEEARKVAAGAAWWAFATGLASALAAMGGGIIATSMR